MLKGAEELAIRKPVKKEFGGGMKEFVFEDQDYFDGVEDTLSFLTSQERQSIVRNMLHNLRAIDSDHLLKVKFVEGQAIGEWNGYTNKFNAVTWNLRMMIFFRSHKFVSFIIQ